MKSTPVKIERRGDEAIRIEWSDGRKREYKIQEIRRRCPCAMCQEEQDSKQDMMDPSSLPILTKTETAPLRILSMNPVGNYGYKIAFSDGHDLGIYTFDLLRSLGKPIDTDR